MTQTRFEVYWAEAAIRDLEQIVDYVEQEAPMAAQRLFDRITERAQALARLPARGRIVPELARLEITTYRELLINPYRLMYRIDADRVRVVAVYDGRRNLEDVLLARLIRA